MVLQDTKQQLLYLIELIKEREEYQLYCMITILTLLVLWQVYQLREYIFEVEIRRPDIQYFEALDDYDKDKADELIQELYEMAVDKVPGLIAKGGLRSASDKLTIYSLYKQVESGNAPNKSDHSGPIDAKYKAWRSQFQKFDSQCMREYITIVSDADEEMRTTVENVLSGKILKINYKSKGANSTGGALAKATSKPKNTHAAADQAYVAGLNNRELQLLELYDQVRQEGNGEKLVELVKGGAIKPSERNGLGQCPLLFASDCSFGVEICEQLVSLGCDINSVDENGDSLLHQAVLLENAEMEKWLVETKGMSKDMKNNDGETPYD